MGGTLVPLHPCVLYLGFLNCNFKKHFFFFLRIVKMRAFIWAKTVKTHVSSGVLANHDCSAHGNFTSEVFGFVVFI